MISVFVVVVVVWMVELILSIVIRLLLVLVKLVSVPGGGCGCRRCFKSCLLFTIPLFALIRNGRIGFTGQQLGIVEGIHWTHESEPVTILL